MAGFNYPGIAATATRLLQRFGAACTVKRLTGSVYDPATSTNVPTYAETASTAAVFAYEQKYIDGTLIRQGDQRAFCAPGAEVRQGDKLVWQGKTFEVVASKPVSPAGVPVLYEAQIRG